MASIEEKMSTDSPTHRSYATSFTAVTVLTEFTLFSPRLALVTGQLTPITQENLIALILEIIDAVKEMLKTDAVGVETSTRGTGLETGIETGIMTGKGSVDVRGIERVNVGTEVTGLATEKGREKERIGDVNEGTTQTTSTGQRELRENVLKKHWMMRCRRHPTVIVRGHLAETAPRIDGRQVDPTESVMTLWKGTENSTLRAAKEVEDEM
jgi:hypothetical protein